jgi:crossover junction endodeoxyribonuclease RuvC
MSLDLSLNGTGVCIYGDVTKEMEPFLIKTNKLKDHMKKIVHIKKVIFKNIRNFNIKKVFIEGQSYGSRGRAILSIAQLHGVIMYFLIKKKIPYECIPPTQVKKYVTGKGNCKKSLILKSLYKYYGFDIDQEDMADSIAVMITGMKMKPIFKEKKFRRVKHG